MIKPFFSVIIPLYNKEKYIKRSIKSVLNQTFIDFELLIINDNSSDKSLEIAKKITDKRIKIFNRTQKGPGGYAARNLGAKNANANHLAFLDADDEWFTEHLQEHYELINKFPEAKLFATEWKLQYKNTTRQNNYTKLFIEEQQHILPDFLKLTSQNIFTVNSTVVVLEKDAFNKTAKFPEGKCKRGGDIVLWLEFFLKYKIAKSTKITAIYYQDDPNAVGHDMSGIEVPYISKKVSELIKNPENEKNIYYLKKYSNIYSKTTVLHSIVFNKNKKEILNSYFKEVDKKRYIFYKFIYIFPGFILTPLYKLYRCIMNFINKFVIFKL